MRFLFVGTNALVQLDHVILVTKHEAGGTKWVLAGSVNLTAPDISLEQAKKAIKESEEL